MSERATSIGVRDFRKGEQISPRGMALLEGTFPYDASVFVVVSIRSLML